MDLPGVIIISPDHEAARNFRLGLLPESRPFTVGSVVEALDILRRKRGAIDMVIITESAMGDNCLATLRRRYRGFILLERHEQRLVKSGVCDRVATGGESGATELADAILGMIRQVRTSAMTRTDLYIRYRDYKELYGFTKFEMLQWFTCPTAELTKKMETAGPK